MATSTPRLPQDAPPTRVAVFQPRPGLGDLIWHLPVIRAFARHGPVTLVTKPSTQADVLLRGDPAVGRIVWFDRNPRQGIGYHDGPMGFARLIATLRGLQAETCVLLHHGASLAAAMALAGIPQRQGYGYTPAQRMWLNRGPFLAGDVRFAEAFEQASAYALAAGLTDLPEPAVGVDETARARVLQRLGHLPRPWAAFGIGSHGANRQWGAARFAALAERCLQRGGGSVLLLAAAHEMRLAEQVLAAAPDCRRVHPVVGWRLPDIMALLAEADMFIGNDSGLMNLRAACGQPAYGLFGASGPLRHTRLIRPVVPAGGPRAGMAAISVDGVMDALGS